MSRSLHLIDSDTGEIFLALDRLEANCLATDLMYTIDYRPEEYPEYQQLQDALCAWLGRG